ncbi:MAG: hypothetical protein EPO00_06685 [Chloroflexota bacterium]|nr:MAG: hypothetical protein EPO00_06685 [Chloroflexota bacterium]
MLKRARAHGATAIAIVLDLPPDLVLARNAGRPDRVVPEPAVRRQLAMLTSVTDPVLTAEGFAIVRRVRTDADLAAVRIEDGAPESRLGDP